MKAYKAIFEKDFLSKNFNKLSQLLMFWQSCGCYQAVLFCSVLENEHADSGKVFNPKLCFNIEVTETHLFLLLFMTLLSKVVFLRRASAFCFVFRFEFLFRICLLRNRTRNRIISCSKSEPPTYSSHKKLTSWQVCITAITSIVVVHSSYLGFHYCCTYGMVILWDKKILASLC